MRSYSKICTLFRISIIFLYGIEVLAAADVSVIQPHSSMSMAIHILGDFFAKNLKGTDGQLLEGNYMPLVFQKFMCLLENERFKEQSEIKIIKDRIQNAIEIEKLPHINLRLQHIQSKLDANEPFLCSWGFRHKNEKHAMLVEFEPSKCHFEDSQDIRRYDLTIYNTGDGIEYHQPCRDCQSYKIQPFVEFKNINVMKLRDSAFLAAFLAVNMNGNAVLDYYENRFEFDYQSYECDYTASYIYEVILQDFNDNKITIPIEPAVFQKPQLSGTCTASVIWAFMLKKLHSSDPGYKLNYKKLKEDLQIIYLREVLDQTDISAISLDEIHLWRLIIEHSLSNLARHKDKRNGLPESDLMDRNKLRDEILQLGITKIREMETKMNQKPLQRLSLPNQSFTNKIAQVPDIKLNPPTKQSFSYNCEHLSTLSSLYKLHKDHSFDPVIVLETLKNFIVDIFPDAQVEKTVTDPVSFEKSIKEMGLIVSGLINRIDIDLINHNLERNFRSRELDYFYKSVIENAAGLIRFFTSKKVELSPTVLVAIARLNYIGWRAACQWDKFIFVPNQFGQEMVEELQRENPNLFIESYPYKLESLDSLFRDSVDILQKPFIESSILNDAIKLKDLFKLVSSSDHSESLIASIVSSLSLSSVFDSDIFFFKSTPSTLIRAYGTAYYEVFQRSAKGNEPAPIKSYKHVGQYMDQLKKKETDSSSYDVDIFKMTSPLFFVNTDTGTPIEPPLSDLNKSPFANLRLMYSNNYNHDHFKIDEYYKFCGDQSISSVKILESRRNERGMPNKPIFTIEYSTPKFELPKPDPQEALKYLSNIKKEYYDGHRLINIKSDEENKSIIRMVKDSIDHNPTARIPSKIVISTRSFDDLMGWSEVWNRFDDGSLSLTDDMDCIWMQTRIFSSFELKKIFDSLKWPHQAILHSHEVLRSIYRFSIKKYLLSWLRNDLDIIHLKRAGMAAYTLASLLTLAKDHLKKNPDLWSQFKDIYQRMIREQQESIEADLRNMNNIELLAKSMGLLHSALLIIYDNELGGDEIRSSDEFKPILEHYAFFNLFLDSNSFNLTYVVHNMSCIYHRRILEFLHIQTDSPKKLYHLIEEILEHGYPVFDKLSIGQEKWKPDDDPSYRDTLTTVGQNKAIFNALSANFATDQWKPIKLMNCKEFQVDPELKDIIEPLFKKGSLKNGYYWHYLSKDIRIGVKDGSRNTTLLQYKGEDYFLAMKWEKAKFNELMKKMVFRTFFSFSFIFNPSDALEEFYVWQNSTKILFTNKQGKLLYQVCNDTATSHLTQRSATNAEYVRLIVNSSSEPIEIEAASDFDGESSTFLNFIPKTMINCILGRPSKSKSIIAFKQRLANDHTLTNQQFQADGFILLPYRFDPSDESSTLVILKNRELPTITASSSLESSMSMQDSEHDQRWVVQHEKRYLIEEDQDLKIGGTYLNHNFLLVSHNRKWYALAPIDNTRCFNPTHDSSGNIDSSFSKDDPEHNISRLVAIDVIRSEHSTPSGEIIYENSLAPSTREHLIFAAYYCLGKRLYPEALRYLKNISMVCEFTDEEMKLLEMFFNMIDKTKDYFPEAAAIRIYASYIAWSSARTFNSCKRNNKPSPANTLSRKWKICEITENDDFSGDQKNHLLDDLEIYFSTENNLSPFFTILDVRSGRKGLLSRDETIQFLFEKMKSTINRPHTAMFLSSELKIASLELNSSPVKYRGRINIDLNQLEADSAALSFISRTMRRIQHYKSKLELSRIGEIQLADSEDDDDSMYAITLPQINDIHDSMHGLVKYHVDAESFEKFNYGLTALYLLNSTEFLRSGIESLTHLSGKEKKLLEEFWNYVENGDYSDRSEYRHPKNNKLNDLNEIMNKVWPEPSSAIHIIQGNMVSEGSFMKYFTSTDQNLTEIEAAYKADDLESSFDELMLEIAPLLAKDHTLSNELIDIILKSSEQNDSDVVQKTIESLDFKFQKGFFAKMHSEFIEDVRKGIVKYKDELRIESFRIDTTQKSSFLAHIKAHSVQYQKECNAIVEQIIETWKAKIDFASYSNLLSERRKDLPSHNEMFSILAKRTKRSVIDVFPGINDENIELIFNLIIKYAFLYTSVQHWNSIIQMMDQEPINIPEIYRLIEKERSEDWIKIPWIMAFEASAEIRLKKDQVKVIKKLGIKNEEGIYLQKIVQRLMAYGKTFVLGTCLALAKADGYHLSILIPPASLFESNSKDMSARASQYFSQKANVIVFHRENDLEIEFKILRSMISTMHKTIVERGFIIMTIETLQALMNRWVIIKREISLNVDEIDEEIARSHHRLSSLFDNLKLLEFIFKILGERGAALFDEIDMTFDPFKDLSFPLSEKTLADKNIVDMIIYVIQKMATEDDFKKTTGIDIAKGNQSNFDNLKTHKELFIKYTSDWIQNNQAITDESQIIDFLSEVNEGMLEKKGEALINQLIKKKTIDHHLTDDMVPKSFGFNDDDESRKLEPNPPNFVYPNSEASNFNPFKIHQFKEILSAAYLFVNSWLDRDLQSKVGETMGRAANSDYLLASPYLAANTPKEGSEFSDKWQTVVLTCLMYANLGLTAEQAQEWIDFLTFKRSDSKIYIEQFKDDSQHARFFKFAQKNLGDHADFSKLLFGHIEDDELAILKTSLNRPDDDTAREVVFDYVRGIVFQKYEIYAEQVYSTTLDACGMFKTHQGYSGTLPNKYIYDHRMTGHDDLAIELDEGVNGMATHAILLAEKKRESAVYEFDILENLTQYVPADSEGSEDSTVHVKAGSAEFESYHPKARNSPSKSKDRIISTEIIDIRLEKFFRDLKENVEPEKLINYTSLIDIGARFKNFKALDIAKAVLKYFGQFDDRIRCVIFFDEKSNQRMYLKDVDEGQVELKFLPPTPKGREDIYKHTDVPMHQIFIIYGQRHITGVDIEQPSHSRAIVTLDKDCTLRDLLQGAFRMRKILLHQRVDFFISKTYGEIVKNKLLELEGIEHSDTHARSNPVTISDLVKIAAYYQYDKVQKENRVVVFQKINAALIKNLIGGKLIDQKSITFNGIYDLRSFIRSSEDRFWQQIISPSKEDEMLIVLNKYVEKYKGFFTMPEGENLFLQEAEEILKYYPDAEEKVKVKNESTLTGQHGPAKECQMVLDELIEEVDESLTQQNVGLVKTDTMVENLQPYESNEIEWSDLIIDESSKTRTLRSLVNETGDFTLEANFLDENIYATLNYIMTAFKSPRPAFKNDTQGRYRKNPSFVLVIPAKEDSTQSMKTILLSNFDTQLIVERYTKNIMDDNCGIFTINGTPMISIKFVPDTDADESLTRFDSDMYIRNCERLLDQGAESHLAQIALFSGNFEMLDESRYANFFKRISTCIMERRLNFLSFMEDERNYLIPRKDYDRSKSWILEMYDEIRDKMIISKPLALESGTDESHSRSCEG